MEAEDSGTATFSFKYFRTEFIRVSKSVDESFLAWKEEFQSWFHFLLCMAANHSELDIVITHYIIPMSIHIQLLLVISHSEINQKHQLFGGLKKEKNSFNS